VRQLKLAGLLVVLALTLAASVGASSALAEYHSEAENTTWSGTLAESQQLDLGGTSLTCTGGALSCSTTSRTVEALKLSPQITSCGYMGISTSWAINGCQFQLRGSHFSIRNCTSPMRWSVTAGGQPCTIEIGNQGGRASVSYANTGSGSTRKIVATFRISGLTYTSTGSWCEREGTFNNGTYAAAWNLSGKLTGTEASQGVWVEGGWPAPSFFDESSPAVLGGSQQETQTLSAGGDALKCSGVSYKGEAASLGGSLTVTPTYSGCTFFGVKTTPSMGGCTYTFNAGGSLSIGGANCAAEPIKFYSTVFGLKCTVTVGPQTVSSVAYENVGSGIVASENISGLQYTATGPLCYPSGTQSSGTLTGASTLTATTSGGKTQALWIE
jgi:hypothetical protein